MADGPIESKAPPVAEALSVSKMFGATRALNSVDLAAHGGEIHALLGENGAGKTTLAAILSGALQPDSGGLRLNGEAVHFASTHEALRCGVAIVHQEPALMPSLTVRQNLTLGFVAAGRREFSTAKGDGNGAALSPAGAALSRRGRATGELVDHLIAEFSLQPYADRRVGELSQATRQSVEIARSLGLHTQLLILDEPTTALPPRERQDLYDRLVVLRSRGIAIVLITHMLDEALALSDRITVLRDGGRVGTVAARDITIDHLIELMTGRKPRTAVRDRLAVDGGGSQRPPILEVKDLTSEPVVKAVSFTLAEGEIVGLAGLTGSGRTETLKAIFGVGPRNSNSVSFRGRVMPPNRPQRSLSAGIALLPEDRQVAGLFGALSIAENIAMGVVTAQRGRWRSVLTAAGTLRRRGFDALAWEIATEVDIVARDMGLPIGSLSGGNQQKALLGRLLATAPRVLLADEPTRGVSIGSRSQIYELLRRLADGGLSICVASSDYAELVTLCDRIVVLVQGHTVETVAAQGMTADDLLELVLKANRDFAIRPSSVAA
jgi:ribose transport system ATP-binding protein